MIFSFFKRKKVYRIESKDLKWLDPNAVSIVHDLQKAHFDAYLVGGCIRDILLGLKPKDFDIATSARPEEVKKVIKRSQIIGRRFRIVLARRQMKNSPTESSHQLFPALESSSIQEYQITTYRRDPEIENGRLNENVYGNIQQDAFRRDFTLNALYLDPIQSEILDFTGGYRDIKERIIKVIGDPAKRFEEDPIRIFRAVRFLHRTQSQWDPRTFRDLEKKIPELKRAKKERMREEILKSWKEGACSEVLSFLLEKGFWSYITPLYAGKWSRDPHYHKITLDFAKAVKIHPWHQNRIASPYIFLMSYDYWMRHSVHDRNRFEELFGILNLSKNERQDLYKISSVLKKLRQAKFENAYRLLNKISLYHYHMNSQCFYLISILSQTGLDGFQDSWKKVSPQWKEYLDKSRKILLCREKSQRHDA